MPAGAQAQGRGGPPPYTLAPGAKDLRAVLFSWTSYMGMLRGRGLRSEFEGEMSGAARPMEAARRSHHDSTPQPLRSRRYPPARARALIYTAGLLMGGGIGLANGNWLSLAVAIVPAGLACAYRIAVEERALVATLGPAYIDYMKGTRRLIPFVL